MHIISPLIGLPPITDPVVIDGYTQPGSSPNTVLDGDSATLLIVLDGSVDGFADGLQLYAGNSTVRGLVINRFEIGINVSSPGETSSKGTSSAPMRPGSWIWATPMRDRRKGFARQQDRRNDAGGTQRHFGHEGELPNTGQGIAITGPSSIGNLVQGNFIGTDATGTQALGNGSDGILVSSQGLAGSASQTTIRGNLISGNAVNGIEILGGGNNLVAGNLIGTDITGTKDLGNAHDGVVIVDTTDTGVVVATTGNNTVGGTTETDRNVISGNDANGLVIVGATEVGNLVLGNDIGTNIHGQRDPGVDLGNLGDGVLITRSDAGGLTASNNSIGGTTAEERNVISGNHLDGVAIAGDSGPIGNLVQGNYIGTDSTGKVALGNGRSGVRISSAIGSTDSATHNTIGGTAAGAGNLISVNKEDGVLIRGDVTGGTDNVVQGNFIGTDVTGKKDLGNLGNGVKIDLSASQNTIGGTAAGAGNTIAFNGANGVLIGSGTGNGILGNSIFSNVKLGSDLGDDGETLNDKTDADSGANNLAECSRVVVGDHGRDCLNHDRGVSPRQHPSTTVSDRILLQPGQECFRADDFSSLGEGGQFIDFANTTTAAVAAIAAIYVRA